MEAAKEVAIQNSGVWDVFPVLILTPKEEELIVWQPGAGVVAAEWKPEFALAFPRVGSPFERIPPGVVFNLLRTRAVDLKEFLIYCQQVRILCVIFLAIESTDPPQRWSI